MDSQNNSEIEKEKQPLSDLSLKTPPSQDEINKVETKLPKFLIPLLVGFALLILAISGAMFLKNNRALDKAKLTAAPQQTVPTSSEKTTEDQTALNTLYASLNSTYNGKLPWSNINTRIGYRFYPKEVAGLTVGNGEVGAAYDNNFNPLTVFKLTNTVSIPLKNAYFTYYHVPEVLSKKFNLGKADIALPLELKVYEFDRKLSESERSIIAKGENFRCSNDKSKTETNSLSEPELVIYYCNLNLTDEQKIEVKDQGFFDNIYEIYFVERNILIQFSVDSGYISDPQEYLSDYMSKLFNSNDALFITKSQIKSVEDSRKFNEWRRKTFGIE